MFFIGLFIHVVFLFSIFDIYFKSPIVKNVVSYQPVHEAPAERIVLFVIDGLRAESFTDYDTLQYMRFVSTNVGKWGISNTRVPTESRPGHVAVIAGFYEDPSAIAKGWKENPVDFDSVFNHTLHTWCWGTYDIVEIFTKGTVDNHIVVNKFDPYEQTFSADKNTTNLDSWVFNNVKDFFDKASNDNLLKEKLAKKKIAFFLHLLGTDTAGHTHKPNTEDYLTTLRHVDSGIKEIENVIKQYYNDDGKTTFIMTSDHGMTDWGSHGSGDVHETETPYVIWGAGIENNKPTGPVTNVLPNVHRLDINQADLTPLMASILSIPVPVNSIGQLPIDLLDMTLENKAKAIYSNSRQLASQYTKKKQDVERNAITMLYYPYNALSEYYLKDVIENIETLIADGIYDEAIALSKQLISLSLSGLEYYHNYYQRPLLFAVTLSFIGWICCLLKILLVQSNSTQAVLKTKNAKVELFGSIFKFGLCLLAVLGVFLVYAQNLPYQYHAYTFLPIVLWSYALLPLDVWVSAYKRIYGDNNGLSMLVQLLFYVFGSLAMAYSFSYRWMLSIPLFGMAMWPVLSSLRYKLNVQIVVSWSASCFMLSVFTFMPVVGKDVHIELVILAAVLWLCIYSYYVYKIRNNLYTIRRDEQRRYIYIAVFQATLLVLALYNIYVQSLRFEERTPVSMVDQSMAWIIAFISLLLPLFVVQNLVCRLISINTSIFTFYILLSVVHEGLFLLILVYNIMLWLLIEFKLTHSSEKRIIELSFKNKLDESIEKSVIPPDRSINGEDFRRAFFFLLYIIIAFFGTGNIASLNSFEVRWVTCFVTSFQPFLITGLILMKTMAPFICVGSCFRAVQHLTKAPVGYVNLIVLVFSNIMGTQLLYYVKNTGSWLEIGTSISQFVIVQVITLFIVLINQITKVLTEINIITTIQNIMKLKTKRL